MRTLVDDIRYALRQLIRTPGFTALALLTLALGIGANTAIFSVVRGILLRPLPYTEPERAVMLWSHWTGWDQTWVSPSEYADYSRQTHLFSGVAVFDDNSFTLSGEGAAERVRGGLVTANLFGVLGAAPLLGRTFSVEEDQPNGPAVILLGEGLWRRRYGADSAIVGRSIQVNAQPYTVIGVMPAAFRLPVDFAVDEATQVWTPLQLPPIDPTDRGSHGLTGVARLVPGITLGQAQAGLTEMVEGMKQQYATRYDPAFGVTLVSVQDQVLGRIRPAVLLLLGAVLLVLLIACGNVAHLLLARGEGRHRELAIRASLGASRRRLLRQLLTESALLGLIGGALGALLAWWGVAALPAIAPSSLPRVEDVRVDLPVLGATLLLSLLTGLGFGLLPAWRLLRPALQPELREGAHQVTAGRGRRRTRTLLIGAELALATVLVIGAGLLLRSFARLSGIAPGFESRSVLTLRISQPEASYPTRSSIRGFYDRLYPRLQALPGVEAVGAVTGLPLASVRGDWGVTIEGYTPPDPNRGAAADWQVASPAYFQALGIPLVRGRFFADGDREGAPGVALVNEAMARLYWPGADPVGRRLRLRSGSDSVWRTVVGVVGDVRHRGLTEASRPEMYFPQAQAFVTAPDGEVRIRSMALVLRVKGDPARLAAPVRQALAELDPGVAGSDLRTLDEVVTRSIAAPRFTTTLLALFAGLALLLAAVGIYGVILVAVVQRAPELGIRVALGARAADVLRLVLGEGMRPVAAGLAAGVVAALALSRLLRGLLYAVPPTDLLTYLGVTTLLALVALLACWLPARRAARTDPMTALRAE